MKFPKRSDFCVAGMLSFSAMVCTAMPSGSLMEVPGPMGPLKGTLLKPATESVAAILIIPGSGPTDRDGNNPLGVKASTYRLLAEGLASEGFTTLRIDKRGMFGSAAATPDANAVTIADYVADVHSWVTALRKRTGAPCVWLLGHSEGGLVALASARDQAGICGLVLVSTAGRRMGDVLRSQLKANPANGPILPQAMAAIDELEQGHRVDTQGMYPALQGLFNPAIQGFLISDFSHDPRHLISGFASPVLIIQGQRDLQVGEQDAKLLQQADPQAKLVLLPNANHVLKSVHSQSVQDNMATYSNPDLPLTPGVVGAIAEFLAGHSAAGKSLQTECAVPAHGSQLNAAASNGGKRMEINTAAASDGGSLWIGMTENGQSAGYVLNRSIAARGTPSYEQISGDRGVLSEKELRTLLEKLLTVCQSMASDDPDLWTVKEFLEVLQRQAPKRG